MSLTTGILHLFSQETDLLIKVTIKSVNIKLWDILGCFHYILNPPRTTVVFPFSWVNPAYLDIGVQSSIGEKSESESEIELTDFLQVTPITHTTVVSPFSWVNPAYLDIGVQSSIGEKSESESEIELTDFLQVTPITHTTIV